MTGWWAGLSALNQAFFVLAVFFSTLFGWQFVASFVGGLAAGGESELGGDADAADVGAEFEAQDGDLVEDVAGLATLRLLSIRSIFAFGTLFSWAGALYLQEDVQASGALLRAVLWGLAGMIAVALFFWVLPRLTEEGTSDLSTAVGRTAHVYLDIPQEGVGQVRVMVSGAVCFVRARSRDGRHLPAGALVRVVGRLGASTLEVEEMES